MIISRSPLRITLAGGGTDLPSFANNFGGKVLSAAINKYVYVSIIKPFDKRIILKYSDNEITNSLKKIKHPYFKSSLNKFKIFEQIEITTLADIPAGTGLGSSGSFSVALLGSLNAWKGKKILKKDIAEKASILEIHDLKMNVGRQDQYISCYGGLKKLKFNKKNNSVENLNLSKKFTNYLENNSVLFFTGYTRSASDILKSQNILILSQNNDYLNKMKFVTKNCEEVEKALKQSDFNLFSELIKEQWQHKMQRSINISNSSINNIVEYGIKNGALAGKLLGAGGGGFIWFLCKDKKKLITSMKKKFSINHTDFKFEYEGLKILSL